MSKTINLTIRVDEQFKKDVEEACAYLDTTISALIRHELKRTINHYRQQYILENAQIVQIMESHAAVQAHKLLLDYMTLNGGEFVHPSEGKHE